MKKPSNTKPFTAKSLANYYLQINHRAAHLSLPLGCAMRPFLIKEWGDWLVSNNASKPDIRIKVIFLPKTALLKLRRNPPAGYIFKYATYQSLTCVNVKAGQILCTIYAHTATKPLFFFYGVVDLVLKSLLRRLSLFQIHAAGVTNKKGAILALGASGSGKSTLAAHFLYHGLHGLSDDAVILWAAPGNEPRALGEAPGIYVHANTARRYPFYAFLKKGGIKKIGPTTKKELLPCGRASFIKRVASRPRIKIVLFPQVVMHAKTKLLRLSPREAVLAFLRQEPDHWNDCLGDFFSLKTLFRLYYHLSRKARCYKIVLGDDAPKILALTRKLAASL